MDPSKSSKNSLHSLKSISNPDPSDHQRRNIQEANENKDPKMKKAMEKHSMASIVSSGYKKKILAERNDGFSPNCEENISRSIPQTSSVPYDPVSNYTSPRPVFLRYNPNRRREILRRIEGELKKEESQECVEDDDEEEEEEEEVFEEKPEVFGMLWKSFLVLGLLIMSTCYISQMNSSHLLPSNGDRTRFQEEIFTNISDLDVLSKVDIGWIAEEEINSGLLIHDVKEAHDFNEIVTGEKEEETLLLMENDVPNDDESLVEICEETVDTEVLEKKDVLSEFGQDSQNQLVPLMSSTDEDHEEIVDTQVLEKKDVLSEFRQDSQNQLVPLMSLTDEDHEEIVDTQVLEKKDALSEFRQDSQNQLVPWMPLTEGNPLLFLLAIISVIPIGLFSVYFRRPKSESAVIRVHIEAKSTTDSNANLQMENHNVSDVNLEDEPKELIRVHIEAKSTTDSNGNLQMENHNASDFNLEKEHKEFYESRPPLVELLGEFSINKLDSKENEQRRTAVKTTSSTVDKIYRSPSSKSSAAAESMSITTTPKKPLRKEDEEIMSPGATKTPLRRSNRIRNRITSSS